MSTCLIFDANSLYSRSYFASYGEYASQAKTRRTDDPELPEHLYDEFGRKGIGYSLKVVLSLLREDSGRLVKTPDSMLFCWDTQAKKDKQRTTKPPKFYVYQQAMREVVDKMFGAANGESTDEADDAVATAAYRAEFKGDDVIVVSGDKDLHQLVGGRVSYFSLKDKRLLDSKYVCEKWGVKRPIHTALKLAIIGDSVDNIKGVVGFGPKKAEKLFLAIEEGMDFGMAYSAIKDQLTETQKQEFDESLDIVLLKGDIEGIPDPTPIKLADMDYVTSLGYDMIMGDYAQVYAQVNGLEFEDVLG